MRRTGLVGILVLIAVVALGLWEWQWDSSALEAWIEGYPFLGATLYVAVLAVSIVLLPLSSLPLLPFAARLYGVWATALLSAAGWWIGALIAFQVARLGRRYLERVTSLEVIDRFERTIPRDLSFFGIVILRMIFPVDLVSFALGLLKQLSFMTYAVASLIGILPFAFVWSYAGGELSAGRWLSFAGTALAMALLVLLVRRLSRASALRTGHEGAPIVQNRDISANGPVPAGDEPGRLPQEDTMNASASRLLLSSIVTKNIALFVVILMVAVVPLAARYYQDSRDYEIQNLASQLEFFAERGASWVDVEATTQLSRAEDRTKPAYQAVLDTLQRIEREFGVDNAVMMRRQPDGQYIYLAAGHDGFDPGEPADIHKLFPATYAATNDTWLSGEMMHSRLFGGKVGDDDFDQFLQINVPLKRDGQVAAILMLNKFANPVAAAVRAKTIRVFALSVGLLAVGLALFGFIISRMLQPLKLLTAAATEISQGNLEVPLAAPKGRDEVGRLTGAFRAMIEGLRQRDFIRDTFGRYVTKEVVDELLGSPDGLRLGGKTRVITILVTDLRGFTAIAARLAPNEVLEILNRYLEQMVAVIQRHRGTIDEIQGDGILCFFGAPLAAPDDPVRAVACAIEMQQALQELNAECAARGIEPLGMGIGINTGDVIVGNIGSEQRTKYSAIGNAINTAYRIESHTIAGQILVSDDTWAQVSHVARARGSVTAEFKGLEQPIRLWEVEGLGGDYQIFLKQPEEDSLHAIEPPLAVACYVIEGKTVSPDAINAQIVSLGERSAEILFSAPVPVLSNLKVVLESAGSFAEAPELYAKVVPEQNGTADGAARVAFTSVSQAAAAAFTTAKSRVRALAADPIARAKDATG